ncbi:fattyacid-CoA ligase [Pelomyxa schiedti]|nr:fattyacid-CoA ligase [Pelomyxa schiedti]
MMRTVRCLSPPPNCDLFTSKFSAAERGTSALYRCDGCKNNIDNDAARYHCATCSARSNVSYDLCGSCWASPSVWDAHCLAGPAQSHTHNVNVGDISHCALELIPSVVGARHAVHQSLARSLCSRLLKYRHRPLFGTPVLSRNLPVSSCNCGGDGGDGAVVQGYDWMLYDDVYRQSRALGSFLVEKIGGERAAFERQGRVKAVILAPNSPLWCIANFACIFSGAVFVPIALSGNSPTSALPEILHHSGSTIVFCSVSLSKFVVPYIQCNGIKLLVIMPDPSSTPQAIPPDPIQTCEQFLWSDIQNRYKASSTWRPVIEDDPEAVCALLYTSGSSGSPKAAAIPSHVFNKEIVFVYPSALNVELIYMPLPYSSQYHRMIAVLAGGGRLGFSTGNMGNFFEEVKKLEPTFLQAPPVIWNVLYSKFISDLDKLKLATLPDRYEQVEERLLQDYGTSLGSRVDGISVGGALTPPHLVEWLRKCFSQCEVTEGYGTTEAGNIAKNGKVKPGVNVRLQDCPNLGYFSTDVPPRGVLWVKTDDMAAGYYTDESATNDKFSPDGYFCTGDIVEYDQSTRRIKIIDRTGFAIKLSQSIWVAPEYLQQLGLMTCVAAVVVPNIDVLLSRAFSRGALTAQIPDSLESKIQLIGQSNELVQLIREEVCAIAEAHRLQPHEIPHTVILNTEDWTKHNYLTPSMKVNRHALSARFGSECEKLAEEFVDIPLAVPKDTDDISGDLELARQIFMANFHINEGKADVDAPLSSVGVDSIRAIKLSAALSKALGVRVEPHALIGQNGLGPTLRSVVDATRKGRHHPGMIATEQPPSPFGWDLEWELPSKIKSGIVNNSDYEGNGGIFLTGGTGLLGAHILQQILLLTNCDVWCLVRVPCNSTAIDVLKNSLAKYRVSLEEELFSRIHCVPGDISQNKMGLPREEWVEVTERTSLVIHSAASTSSALTYNQIRQPNVNGTLEAIRICCKGCPKRLVYISSISVFHRDETANGPIPEDFQLGRVSLSEMDPYSRSKRIAEMMLLEAFRLGMNVVVIRPGTIAGSTQTGALNPSDSVNRLLATLLHLKGKIPPPSGADCEAVFTSMAPVDWVAQGCLLAALPDYMTTNANNTPPLIESESNAEPEQETTATTTTTRDAEESPSRPRQSQYQSFHFVGPAVSLSTLASAASSISPTEANSPQQLTPCAISSSYHQWCRAVSCCEDCALWPLLAHHHSTRDNNSQQQEEEGNGTGQPLVLLPFDSTKEQETVQSDNTQKVAGLSPPITAAVLQKYFAFLQGL